MMRRDWSRAIERHAGYPCRVCGRYVGVQLAHTIGRKHDDRHGRKYVVNPLAVVPLCAGHHRLYDAYQLDLLPYLTPGELRWAEERIGWGNAHRRIEGRAFLHREEPSTEGAP